MTSHLVLCVCRSIDAMKIDFIDDNYQMNIQQISSLIFQMTEVYSFGNLPVIAHAWNKDRTRGLSSYLIK